MYESNDCVLDEVISALATLIGTSDIAVKPSIRITHAEISLKYIPLSAN